jgi:hypothetical protein
VTLLDSIERLAESCSDEGIGPVVVNIRVESPAQVDALYRLLGEPVGGTYERPHFDDDGRRMAVTTVCGATVMLSQSMVAAMRRAA